MTARPIWLLDFDGVINALSSRGGKTSWDDWHSAVIDHPEGERHRSGNVIRLPLLWSQSVVDTVAHAVAAGVDVRWLTTWREHTALLPDIIEGLPGGLPWLDSASPGQWKLAAAKAAVPDGVPLLWTDDSLSLDFLGETWRTSRPGGTVHIRPREATGLVRKEIHQIREWVDDHA